MSFLGAKSAMAGGKKVMICLSSNGLCPMVHARVNEALRHGMLSFTICANPIDKFNEFSLINLNEANDK